MARRKVGFVVTCDSIADSRIPTAARYARDAAFRRTTPMSHDRNPQARQMGDESMARTLAFQAEAI